MEPSGNLGWRGQRWSRVGFKWSTPKLTPRLIVKCHKILMLRWGLAYVALCFAIARVEMCEITLLWSRPERCKETRKSSAAVLITTQIPFRKLTFKCLTSDRMLVVPWRCAVPQQIAAAIWVNKLWKLKLVSGGAKLFSYENRTGR